MLDLEHHPLVGQVEHVGRLGDDAVEAGALEHPEPALGEPLGVGRHGEVDRRLDAVQRLGQGGPALGEGTLHQRVVAEGEQVEGDERGRRLAGQQVDPGGGRVDALLQRLEVEPLALAHHHLAVHHAALGELRPRLDDLGEVAGHRALVAAAQLDLVAVAEDDRAEAVPLRLVDHAGRQDRHRLGQHRPHGWHHGQVHAMKLAPLSRVAAEPRSPCLRGMRSFRRRPLEATNRPSRGSARVAQG